MTKTDRAPALIGKATYHLHRDDAEAFKAIVGPIAAIGARSAGCVFYHAAQDAADPTTFYLFEGWDSQDSAAAFLATPEFQAALRSAMALRITDRSGMVYVVSDANATPMPS